MMILKHTRNLFSYIGYSFCLKNIYKKQMGLIFSYSVQTFQQVGYFSYQPLDSPLFLTGLFG